MPVPIALMNDNYGVNENDSLFVDYSFLAKDLSKQSSTLKTVLCSNTDASMLMDLWLNSKKLDNDKFEIYEDVIDKNTISQLKSRGLINTCGNQITFTSRGKRIITTMSLAENNKFLKNKKEKKYTEILAGMDKRNKPGYRMPRYAATNLIDLSDI